MARTGSSYLVDALNRHSQISCQNEKYTDQFLKNLRTQEMNIQHLWPTTSKKLMGCKIPINKQHEYPFDDYTEFWETVFDTPTILVNREDEFARYVSIKLVFANGMAWYKMKYSKKVAINIEDALYSMKHAERSYQDYKNKLTDRFCEVIYERIIEGDDYAKALKFLGVYYEKPQSSFTKQRTRSLQEMIINYDELLDSPLRRYVQK